MTATRLSPSTGSDARSALAADLAAIVGADAVEREVRLTDASGLSGVAPILVRPRDAATVAEVVTYAYAQDVAIIPVGGATGYSGGIVPQDLGDRPAVAVALGRLTTVRSFAPLLWRAEVEAGVTTARVAELARRSGLLFPPDPGAAQSSQIGGNLATNAGGPHAFKYGVTNRWVTGVEAVLAPGELVRFGGPIRKDVAGYDLKSLLIGSEGTLGIITAAWLKFAPAPVMRLPVLAGYESVAAGVDAIDSVLSSGVVPGALEYLHGSAINHAPPPFLADSRPPFIVIAEAESEEEFALVREALGPGALAVDAAELWRWREGVSLKVRAVKGEKLAEDIAVPLDRLSEAISGTVTIGERHGLEATSWGHAGDGNLHSTFLFDPRDPDQVQRSELAAADLFELARQLGGSVSGEHGLGKLKRGQLLGQWSDAAVRAHETVKSALDPKGLFNPGTKDPRPISHGHRTDGEVSLTDRGTALTL